MTAAKSATFLLLLALGTGGSMCRGPSGTSDPGAKDQAAPAEVNLPGIDTSALTPREKRELAGYVNEFLSPCANTPVPVAQCVIEKRACARCVPAAKFLARGVRDGMSREQIERAYKNRFDADRIKNIPIDGSPSKGPEAATVTVVEFADFECPFCGIVAPMLEKAWSEHKDRVRMVYKFMALPSHTHGEAAARAAFAAGEQGKFWEMHEHLFANQKHLEASDIDGYARELKLDIAKLHTDMASQAATDRLARDQKAADAAQVKGTPAIFVNGRELDAAQNIGDWLATELGAVEPAPAPSASGK